MFGVVSSSQFTQLSDEIMSRRVKLVICDFNGVLDDYYDCKYTYLRQVLGEQHAEHLAELAVFTDTEYARNQSATLEDSIRSYLASHRLMVDGLAEKTISTGMRRPELTPEGKSFLAQMPMLQVVVYTAQSRAIIDEYQDGSSGAEWISAQELGEPKPSVQNLEKLMRRYSVAADEVCVIGDGLIDDLMPAKLLGMHTILVTPFTDTIVASQAR